MAPIAHKDKKPKIGEDGLTRQQRYYKKNEAKIKEKVRMRKLKLREARRESKPTAHGSSPDGVKELLEEPHDRHATLQAPIPALSIHPLQESPMSMRFPPDFYPSARKNADACFGEAMQVLRDDRIIDPVPEGLTEIDRVANLNKAVLRWASGWGGVAYWPISFDYSFTRAQKEGRQDQWHEEMLNHASMGRRLLAQLQSMGGQLPKEPYKVRELWRLQIQLVEMLVMGITIINTRCSVLPHYWKVDLMPPVPYSDDDSGECSDDSIDRDADNEAW